MIGIHMSLGEQIFSCLARIANHNLRYSWTSAATCTHLADAHLVTAAGWLEILQKITCRNKPRQSVCADVRVRG